MSLKALRSLSMIAREGSFAAASEKLHVTQSAISVQIKSLEQQLGFELFDRTSRSPRLNPDGREVLERSEHILGLYERLGDGLGPDGDFSYGFTIGAIRSAQQVLAPVLAALMGEHPRLQIKVVRGLSLDLAKRVENGELDAALIAEPGEAHLLLCDWELYQQEPFYMVAPAGAQGNDEDLLNNNPFIRFDRNAWAGRAIDDELKRRELKPQEVMELDSLEPALDMVKYGLGVTVIPFSDKDAEHFRKKFYLVPFGAPQRVRRMGLYQKKSHPRRRVADKVASGLKKR